MVLTPCHQDNPVSHLETKKYVLDHPASLLDVRYDMTLDTDNWQGRIPINPEQLQGVPQSDIQLRHDGTSYLTPYGEERIRLLDRVVLNRFVHELCHRIEVNPSPISEYMRKYILCDPVLPLPRILPWVDFDVEVVLDSD